ncbi:MAG: AAA family ATPase [Oligoflexia bacterium]|nr:AAA family ATPase [Oligoflexia bacterium]
MSRVEKILSEIDILVRSRYPLIYILSHEEHRIEKLISRMIKNQKKAFKVWSVTSGLKDYKYHIDVEEEKNDVIETNPIFTDPLELLEHIIKNDEATLFLLKDFHAFLDDFTVIRKLRDAVYKLNASYKNIIIVSPVLKLPEDLQKEICLIDFPLPDHLEIFDLLRDVAKDLKQTNSKLVNLNKEDGLALAKAAQGLTLFEAENVFSKAVVIDSVLDKRDLDLILKEKQQIVRKSGILEYYPSTSNIDDLGGQTKLKKWLSLRGKALFSEEAKKFGIPSPKGILLLGPPGTGKSLTAKAISNFWKLPLLKLDFGKIFSGLVGSSEENMRTAIKTAEGLAPAVLWVDEIEKGLSGEKGGKSDGGTSARVLGTFLTWMQEKESNVFVFATANSIDCLPPELLRKGRFDEIFFLDLPSNKEREEIVKIHLTKRKRDFKIFDLQLLSEKSKGYSGAEIEQSIIEALYNAFYEQRELNTNDIAEALKIMVPLSTTHAETIKGLREWAQTRARMAA